jgi:hypothetical protein
MNSSTFLSPDGFSTSTWGPHAWVFMTLVAANYPLRPSKDDAIWYYTFYKSLGHVIPCGECRREYCKMIGDHKKPSLCLHMKMFLQNPSDSPGTARKRVFTWVVNIHNNVNKRKRRKIETNVNFWAKEYASLRLDKLPLTTCRCMNKKTRVLHDGKKTTNTLT